MTTSSKGLISAPKTAQLKHKAANIKFAPFQPYWSNKKLASGAKTKVPTPLPQTAMPRNEIESVLQISKRRYFYQTRLRYKCWINKWIVEKIQTKVEYQRQFEATWK